MAFRAAVAAILVLFAAPSASVGAQTEGPLVVVAEVSGRPNSYGLCGVMDYVGALPVRVISVEAGSLTARELVALISCPRRSFQVGDRLRMVLRPHPTRLRGRPRLEGHDELPRYRVRRWSPVGDGA